MIDICDAQHPREGAWRAFLAYDRSPYSDSCRAWCWAVYRADDQHCWPGQSRRDQQKQPLDEVRATLAREVLQYCGSKLSQGNMVDLYVETDRTQFADLARDWESLDAVVRLIGNAENPARILTWTNKSRRLNWL